MAVISCMLWNISIKLYSLQVMSAGTSPLITHRFLQAFTKEFMKGLNFGTTIAKNPQNQIYIIAPVFLLLFYFSLND